METNRKSQAYDAGLKDGLAWDLDGYRSDKDVRQDCDGWCDATISGLREQDFCKLVGIRPGDWGTEIWEQACSDYNRGCYDGATAPQSERTGLPAGYGRDEE